MQGRQRVVRHPVGDSPLESASIGRHSRLRQAACRMASPWRLPGESASSGKVFLLGEADSTQCAFRGRQQAVRIVTSLRRTLLQPFVSRLACPSRDTARLCHFNASSACHNLTALCYTLWCVEPVI